MIQTAQWNDYSESGLDTIQRPRRLSFLKFLLRYPIFLLAFGPPMFRQAIVETDTSQAHFDIWNVLQVAWLGLISLHAILHLTAIREIMIPKQVRSILKLSFYLGILFLVSVTYSPGRVISAEYCLIYFLNLACMVEFIVDVYRNPPNWMQAIFQIRTISVLLLLLVLLTLPINPKLVMAILPGAGIRLLGGTVAAVPVISPLIAIISAYSFLHSLESRVRSSFFFIVGLAGTLITQWRGAEVGLLVVLSALVMGWAMTNKRTATVFISGLMALVLVGVAVMGFIGPDRIWKAFNRGQNTESITSLSGRTEVWVGVIRYCLTQPQGMGYISGIRHSRIAAGTATSLHATLSRVGGTDNSFLEVLADAGWLALGVYLAILGKTFALGWRSSKKHTPGTLAPDRATGYAIRCALLLLLYCLVEGMDSSVYTIPSGQAFYIQNIIIAIVLGASANILAASRARQFSLAS